MISFVRKYKNSNTIGLFLMLDKIWMHSFDLNLKQQNAILFYGIVSVSFPVECCIGNYFEFFSDIINILSDHFL